jgi:Uma2 family endonuclease
MPTDLDTDRFWTLEEFHATPEFSTRVDLVEGRLRVMPPPKPLHNHVTFRLQSRIDSALPSVWRVYFGVGVLLSDHPKKPTEVMPDLTVLSASHNPDQSPVLADNVLLVVEVVSRSSRRKDRLEYPTYYAAAGIPFYWRVETPMTAPELKVLTHKLGDGVYVPAGEFTDELKVEEPFPMAFDVPSLME